MAWGIGRVAGQLEIQGDAGNDHGQQRAANAQRTAIGAVDIGHVSAQQDKRQSLHEIREHRAKYRHVEQGATDDLAAFLRTKTKPQSEHHRERGDAAKHHRHVWGFALAMGDRKPGHEIARTTERINLPTFGEDDRVKTRHQPQHSDQRQQFGGVVAVDRLEAVEQGFTRRPQRVRADAGHRRIEPENHERGNDQREHAGNDALGHIALGIDRFLGGQRQLFDRQKQPDGKRQRRQNAFETEWQKRTVAVDQFATIGANIHRPAVEVDMRQRTEPEHYQAGQGQQGNRQSDPK